MESEDEEEWTEAEEALYIVKGDVAASISASFGKTRVGRADGDGAGEYGEGEGMGVVEGRKRSASRRAEVRIKRTMGSSESGERGD